MATRRRGGAPPAGPAARHGRWQRWQRCPRCRRPRISPAPSWDSFSSGVRSSLSSGSISLPLPAPRSAPSASSPAATAERPESGWQRRSLPAPPHCAALCPAGAGQRPPQPGGHVRGADGRKRPQPQLGAAPGPSSAAIFGKGSARRAGRAGGRG